MILPDKIFYPFAKNGDKRIIPAPSQIEIEDGAASFNDGFPPLTMIPIEEGGVPPAGIDFNGIFYMLSAIAQWVSAGGTFQYDEDFAESLYTGGYPEGAVVRKADNTGFWFCTVDGNQTNPDLGGAGWVDYFYWHTQEADPYPQYLLKENFKNAKLYYMGQI